jgi:sec-independent protein translocase protein TatB
MTAGAVSLAFLTGGAIGPGEMVLVFVAVLLLFGPRRLPDLARGIGRILNEIRRASHEFQDQMMRLDEPRAAAPPDPPLPPPREDPPSGSPPRPEDARHD